MWRAPSVSACWMRAFASAESDAQTTPSLSRASSESGGSADEVRTPPGHAGAEFGVLAAAKDAPAGVELRVNDVTVEIIGLHEKERLRRAASAPTPPAVEKAAAPERKGTIRRVWRRLTGSTRR